MIVVRRPAHGPLTRPSGHSNISYFENSLFQIARFYVLILTWE